MVETRVPKTRVVAGFLALTIASVGLTACGVRYDGDTTECTVTDKYVAISNKSSEKRISTSCGVFKVEDEISQGQWNSADLYARIEVGKTYNLDAYGYRNGFLSLFPNVADATEVVR